MEQLIREWVMSCEQCIRESQFNRNFTRFPLQKPDDHITAPEDAIIQCRKKLRLMALRT